MIYFLLLLSFFLFGAFVLNLAQTSLLLLGRFRSKELSQSSLFFFKPFLSVFFSLNEWENLYFSISWTKKISDLGYAVFSLFFLIHFEQLSSTSWLHVLTIGGSIIGLSFIIEILTSFLSAHWTRVSFLIAAPLASIYLMLFFPIIGCFLKGVFFGIKTLPLQKKDLITDKAQIREMIRESELQKHLDVGDQKLISSFLHFKQRVAKEIMVPRVDLYALAADTSIQDAAPLFASEGYSRIPIYRESLDQVLGVVLYKDLLKCYAQPGKNLTETLSTLAKPVLYSPENKKITQLLQEFRNKQIHMAIIVDEYGGTEGIVTIEDILEELVGEIEDEYDIGEEHDFWEIPGGGWVLDSKMTLFDVEERLGIRLPQNPDYETIGGYIYHCAGTIPAKGWRLSHDAFDLEVLSSDERSIKKVKIQPRIQTKNL